MSKTKPKSKRKPKVPHIVCKPCWELKYCPYGPYVEHFPLSPSAADIDDVRRRYKELLARFAQGEFKTEDDIMFWVEQLEYLWPERWEALKGYDTSEVECRVFGHVCPVFFNKEPFTETRESRRFGRHIPREIMLKVVRRDGQMCQICHKNVSDDELEFDHLIPFSKGGPVSVENLRVLCATCNGKKRDSLDELLEPKAQDENAA
jgi:hypothetical protein